ncbi:MAG: patatin-like phospholipase family protein [Gammaproteobacteria bacterium]|nr:patatin-like phospholipase family protein [Gammaproteobacteria bacterium]
MRLAAIAFVLACGLAGCAAPPRRPAPPTAINDAVPPGFPASVRLVTTDLAGFTRRAPLFFTGIRDAAVGGHVDILSLSGGGSEGAFGAGVLVGLTRAHARPRFDLVTGVSAGALIAPFAFLGSRWDGALQNAFTTDHSALLGRSPLWRFLRRLVVPLGREHDDPLFDMVNHYVTPELVAAVARASEKGRRLVIATTDLDSEETVLWDMGVIAEHGGEAARALFRDVLVASASVPGAFPPVMIRVQQGRRVYDEMHVDGSVTTSLFAFPLVAGLGRVDLPPLHGGELYLIVNSPLARLPKTTPVSTVAVLARSFSAGMTYKTRESIIDTINLTSRLGMGFRMTAIPADFPTTSVVDFSAGFMRSLFDYGERCAVGGRIWLKPDQTLRRGIGPDASRSALDTPCPGAPRIAAR